MNVVFFDRFVRGGHQSPHCRQVEQNNLYQWVKESWHEESNFCTIVFRKYLYQTSDGMNWRMLSSKDSAPYVIGA